MAKHVYHVEVSDGTAYTVTTEHHHEDFHENVFLQKLAQIISQTTTMVSAQMIMRYIYKGRK